LGLQDGAASHGVGGIKKEGSLWKEVICRFALRPTSFACKLKRSQNHADLLFHRYPNFPKVFRGEKASLTVRGREGIFLETIGDSI
jgi:hypothetical protein